MRTYVLDLDDASVLGTRWDILERLKEHYPKLKVTLFWIPFDYKTEMSPSLATLRDARLKQYQKNKDWVEIAPHGITHVPREFEHATRKDMKDYCDTIIDELAKQGVTAVKLFKPPYWLWNQNVVDILNEKGWAGAVDANQPHMPRPKRFYKYTHSIDHAFWKDDVPLLKLHGHMHRPDQNNLEDCQINLMHMDRDAEFKFASELIETL